jgi:hypothetical protein
MDIFKMGYSLLKHAMQAIASFIRCKEGCFSMILLIKIKICFYEMEKYGYFQRQENAPFFSKHSSGN